VGVLVCVRVCKKTGKRGIHLRLAALIFCFVPLGRTVHSPALGFFKNLNSLSATSVCVCVCVCVCSAVALAQFEDAKLQDGALPKVPKP
jgi:hypothetical protein